MKISLPPEDRVGFQMAPMIDIVFLLIIFFMVVAQQSRAQFKPINVPVAENSKVAQEPTERATITLTDADELLWGAEPATLKEVTERTRERVAENERFKIFLRADKAIHFKRVREVMQACAEGGVIDIIFSVHQSDK